MKRNTIKSRVRNVVWNTPHLERWQAASLIRRITRLVYRERKDAASTARGVQIDADDRGPYPSVLNRAGFGGLL